MNKNRIREIFSDDRFTLYAVESIEMMQKVFSTGFTLHGSIKSTAIIIRSPEKNQALDMNASPIELDKLKKSIPELELVFRKTGSQRNIH